MHGRHVHRSRKPRAAACVTATSILIVTGAAGCLNRPLETAEPRTTSTVVEKLSQNRVNKIDLLLAIDNSGSMADKQQILADAVPDLVEGLLNPRCVDGTGRTVTEQPKGPLLKCPTGSYREFQPVLDIHIGIISSSLGGYGGVICSDSNTHTNNDKAHMIARSSPLLQNDIKTYEGTGFLAWDPAQKLDPPGEGDIGTTAGSSGLIPSLRDMVNGVGQIGCGYEAQLESWYRFLVDPEPYLTVVTNGKRSWAADLDSELLKQRADFLRPDSLLAILMLSDENDCSINEHGLAHQLTRAPALPRMRSECNVDLNNACCAPCGEAPAECAPDATCDEPMSVADQNNLRCFDQKNRYGYDFLHPTERYVKGLTSRMVADRKGNLVPNPIFSDLDTTDKNTNVRDKSLVFFAGIVGVPWQDVARDPKDLTKGFKDGEELAAKDAEGHSTWDIILGDPATGKKPLDPFMWESSEARQAGLTNPVTGDAIMPLGSEPNGINGYERVTKGRDLQYACILPLPEPKPCGAENFEDCDCAKDKVSEAEPSPLCDGGSTANQLRAKAYPGLRQLEVLKGLGPQGIVASVCATQVNDKKRDDYGYRPAIGSLVDQLRTALGGQCLPRTLTANEEGQVGCVILEASATGGACSCDAENGRQPVPQVHAAAIRAAQEDINAEDAGWDCFCEIPQLIGDPERTDDELDACQNDVSKAPMSGGEEVNGWCYIDATTTPATGNPTLVKTCANTEQRMVRFVGKGEAQPAATLFITCSGE